MILEYNIWNVTEGWERLDATTVEDAITELEDMGHDPEDAELRNAETMETIEFASSADHPLRFP